MLNAFKAWRPAYKLIFKDKTSLLLALIPILMGIFLYSLLGHYFFSTLISMGQKYIETYLSSGTFGQFVYYLVVAVLTVALYFIVNWTFVLVLSIFAGPFNDLLSQRIEKIYHGEKLPTLGESFDGFLKGAFSTIFNEIKKVLLILFLSIFAMLLGYVPLLTPFSVIITVLLLAISYVDYSWSRHNIVFSDCRKDIRKNFLSYILGGGIFMMIVSVPIINILVPSFATSYFTILWMKNNEHRNKITE